MAADTNFDLDGFLLKDYDLKVAYLTNHLTRMWQRFGMFVTLQSALAALLIVQGKLSAVAAGIAVVEGALALVWWRLGIHDRHLVRLYKRQVIDAAAPLVARAGLEGYREVTDVEKTDELLRKEGFQGSFLEAFPANDVPLLPGVLPGLLAVFWLFFAAGVFIAG